eukprot:4511763-Pleurochrysis_carterae.AAC.2
MPLALCAFASGVAFRLTTSTSRRARASQSLGIRRIRREQLAARIGSVHSQTGSTQSGHILVPGALRKWRDNSSAD